MADDWIPIRIRLHEDPAVTFIAQTTGLSPIHVVGCLVRVWGWFDEQTVNGNAPRVGVAMIDNLVSNVGFGESLVKAGWLSVTDDGLKMPHFEKWHSQNAKRRALTRKRVQRFREKKKVTPVTRYSNAPVTQKVTLTVQDSTGQDRTGQKEKETPPSGTHAADAASPPETAPHK